VLLNGYFVPLYLSNHDYADDGKAPAEEKAELNRMRQLAAERKLEGRVNSVWILNSDGQPIASGDGCIAAAADKMAALLEKHVRELDLAQGPAVAPLAAQSRPPQSAPGNLVLHLTARYLERKGDDLVPLQIPLGKNGNYFMKGFPAE